MKRIVITAIVGALNCAVSAGAAELLDIKFREVKTGTTGDEVISLLGRRPDTDQTMEIVSIPFSTWRWRSTSSGRSFVIFLISNRVVMTQSCSSGANC
jgi:hypothetical protein